MLIAEAIECEKQRAKEWFRLSKKCTSEASIKECRKMAEENLQRAEWLSEIERLHALIDGLDDLEALLVGYIRNCLAKGMEA